MPDMPNVSGTPSVPNAAPDLSNIGSIKTEGAQVKANGESVNSQTLPAAPVKAEAKEVKAAIEKIKLGEGEEYTQAELKSLIEKAKGADKKFLEASKAKKEAMRVFKMAKENPREFLEKTGMDPKKFSYDEVARDIQDKLRDPREVELEKANERLKEFEAKEAEAKKTKDQARIEKEAKALEQRFHAEMIEALEAFPELPKNAYTVAQLARAIDQVRTKHGVLLTAKEVAPLVVKDIRSTIGGLVKGATPEMLIALIGQEGVDALLKHSMAKLKDPLKGGTAGAIGQDGQPVKEQKKYKNSHEYWKSMDRAAKEERERGGR